MVRVPSQRSYLITYQLIIYPLISYQLITYHLPIDNLSTDNLPIGKFSVDKLSNSYNVSMWKATMYFNLHHFWCDLTSSDLGTILPARTPPWCPYQPVRSSERIHLFPGIFPSRTSCCWLHCKQPWAHWWCSQLRRTFLTANKWENQVDLGHAYARAWIIMDNMDAYAILIYILPKAG